jgi:hypothetical protein
LSTETLIFPALDQYQIKECINTTDRFGAFLEARKRLAGYKGSMSFVPRGKTEYLVKDYYDAGTGVKKQTSLGPRSPETEEILADFLKNRTDAQDKLDGISKALGRQAAINRGLNLGRVPEIGARIIRALDASGLLGRGVKVIGTNAMFAYEASTGVRFPSELTTTEDIDMLLDARAKIRFTSDDPDVERTIIGLLRRVDRSFEKDQFQATNRDGYIVDLVRPERNPPWSAEPTSVSDDPKDLEAVQITGLSWHENAPSFEGVAIDTRGQPVRIVAPDPRAFAVHKHWLSGRPDRRTDKKMRDRQQAIFVAQMVVRYMPHLEFDSDALKSFPKNVVDNARHLFEPSPDHDNGFSM